MHFNKFTGILSGIAFLLFIVGINGNDIGLPMFISSHRVGILILAIVNILLFYKNGFTIKINKGVFLLFLFCVFIVIWASFSVILSPFYSEVSVSPMVTWILIGFVIVMVGNIFISSSPLYYYYLLNTMIIVGSLLTFFYFVWSYTYVGNFSNSFLWRDIFRNTSNGLNRIMNGLLIINIINLAVLTGVVKEKRNLFLFSFFSVLTFVSFIFLTGSRQTFIALLFSFLLLIFLKLKSKDSKRFFANIKMIISSIVLILVTTFIISYVDIWGSIESRFIDNTLDGNNSDQSRIQIIQEVLFYIQSYPIFGIGPNVFISISAFGKHTHNGYANLLISFGILPTVLLLLMVLVILLLGFKRNNSTENLHKLNFYYVAYVVVFIYAAVSNFFNDLLDEYIFWILITFLVCMPILNHKTMKGRKDGIYINSKKGL